LLNLHIQVSRRTIYMQNFIRGDIDSVELVRRLTFNVPVRLTRSYYPLNLTRCTSNCCLHEPFGVLYNNYKNLYHLLSTSTSIPVLKTNILTHLLHSYLLLLFSFVSRLYFVFCIFLANSHFLPKMIKGPRA